LIYFQFHHSIPFLYVMFSNLILILLIFLVLLLNFFFSISPFNQKFIFAL
jgi:hypothetical protein